MTIEQIVSEHGYEISALEWLVAAALARTFSSEAELRTWGDAALVMVLGVVEDRPDQPNAEYHRETFDRVLSLAVSYYADFR